MKSKAKAPKITEQDVKAAQERGERIAKQNLEREQDRRVLKDFVAAIRSSKLPPGAVLCAVYIDGRESSGMNIPMGHLRLVADVISRNLGPF